ncbi:MAG: DUF2088 domain-containing protein [Deltaproteobacteria bacterium]|nr:DUF2088 domain-containing protein [Deltaproteobacteria bacterium]
MKYPKWIQVRQLLDGKRVDNPYRSVQEQLQVLEHKIKLSRGARIAVAAGSRHIANIVPITKAAVDFIKTSGGNPFIVPSMGSHGGGTAEGQVQVLTEYGLTEEALGAPILSSMEVVRLGDVDGIPVYLDKKAVEADGIVVINRIKPHQVFKGDIQSGLNKMLVVGLGKRKGADAVHGSGRIDVLPLMGDYIRSSVSVLFGVAILENSYDETRDVAVIEPGQFNEYDRRWAEMSRALLPRIPIRQLDMVLVDAMGKDVSGSGMDTNVIGFTRRIGGSGQAAVPLAVLDLTEKTEGNAMGMGLADFTTRRLVDKINFAATYTNVLASGIYSTGRIPIIFERDKDIFDAALGKREDPSRARIIRIKDTLHLDRFFATEELIAEIKRQDHLKLDDELIETTFDLNGNLDFGF